MDVNEIIGMEEMAAKKKLLAAGYTSIVVSRDGEPLAYILIACHYHHLTVEKGR